MDVNLGRDSGKIKEQYYIRIKNGSLKAVFPELAKEWYQPENGNIFPDMVSTRTNDKYFWKCPICGEIYSASVYSRTVGHGCAKCAGVSLKKNELFLDELKQKHPNIEALEEYRNANTRILCRCKICGNEWPVSPHNLLNGSGCSNCARKRSADTKRKTDNDFKKKVAVLHPNIRLLGVYTGSHNRILCECLICGHKWSPEATSLSTGYGCPKCAGMAPKKVRCIDTGEIFQSMSEAEKAKNVAHSTLSKCCNGKLKTAGGYRWEFV